MPNTKGPIQYLDPLRTMEIILESLRELVDYELAVVLGFAEKDRLRVRKAMGPLAQARFAGYEIPLGQRADLAKILEEGKPRFLDTGAGHPDTYAEILDLPEGHSCLAAPLLLDGVPIGLITFDHRDCGAFSPEILGFLGVISRLIALALLQADSSAAFRERTVGLLAERNSLIDLESEVFRSLAGRSPSWVIVLDSLRLVAATDAPVLLLGQTGTGKEEAARAIHRLSTRAGGPFVALNCSALPQGLAESELFGHEKGSFTGAQALRHGRFELANGGTLFLDEIGDLPLEIQPKLLRVLQEGRLERVGGEKAVSVNLRIIAATHVELGRAVELGRFREDLFYRLAVFPIRMPSLEERGDDVLILAELFASRLRKKPGWASLHFTAAALAALRAKKWPGNVRELQNLLERAAILARGGEIDASHIAAGDAIVRCGPCALEPGRCPDGGSPMSAATGALTLAELERGQITRCLAAAGGKIYGSDGAAALLGLKPSTLQSRMKKIGIEARSFRPIVRS